MEDLSVNDDCNELSVTDGKALYSKVQRQEKQLKLKRSWLMGLPLSDHEEKDLRVKLSGKETLPESLIRSDDVHYEMVKTFVEKAFWRSSLPGGHHADPENKQNIDMPNLRKFMSMLDDMTNCGLLLLAEIITGDSVKFQKTREKMKKIIRKSLPRVFKKLESNCDGDLAKQLNHILWNPHNFRRNCLSSDVSTFRPYHAAMKVLEGLEKMSIQSLSAMHRKLRGIQGYVPQLRPKKSGWNRTKLTDLIRKSCSALLSELGEEDELQEPLAKAMAVGGLSLKLLQSCSFVPEFWQFSPEIGALHTEIAKAIRLIKDNVAFPELKNLQLLIDPDAKISNRSLRTSVRNLLREYLFECSDMETIPDYIIKVVAIINGSSKICPPNRVFSEEEREEEVELVLAVSAQIKQILWDMLPENDFNEDFKDAYMEDSEESDDDDDDDLLEENDSVITKTNLYPLYYTCEEACGESNPVSSVSDTSAAEGKDSYSALTPKGTLRCDSTERAENGNVTRMTPMYSEASASHASFGFQTGYSVSYNVPDTESGKPTDNVCTDSSLEPKIDSNKMGASENQYLAIQEACDKTSMVAHSLIGCLLNEIAQIDAIPLDSRDVPYLRGGDSVQKIHRVAKEEHMSNEERMHGSIVQVLEEILPSFPQSGKARLKEFMSIK